MKKERTFFEKVVIFLYEMLLFVSVGSFVLEITKYCTFTISLGIIFGVICLYCKANEILERERYNEEFRKIQEVMKQQGDHQK